MNRFSQEDGEVTFSVDSVKRQFNFFLNDSTVEMEMILCGGDIVKFWCHLYKYEGDEYKAICTFFSCLTSPFNFSNIGPL